MENIDKEKFEYIEVNYFLFHLPKKETPAGIKQWGKDNWESDINALGNDGWEMILFHESIIFGTSLTFRRPKDVSFRKQWEYAHSIVHEVKNGWEIVLHNKKYPYFIKRAK